jgi:hypothetical protein
MDAKPTMRSGLRSRVNLPRVEMARLRVKVRVRQGAQTVYARSRTGQRTARTAQGEGTARQQWVGVGVRRAANTQDCRRE